MSVYTLSPSLVLSSNSGSTASFEPSADAFDGAGEARAVGLVPYTTTRTVVELPAPAGMIVVHHDVARLRRMKHHVRTAGRLTAETMARHGGSFRAVFLTLTYADGSSWSGSHLTAFFHRVRSWSARRGFRVRYVWVAELQKRGAIHYHAVIWLPAGVRLPRADSRGWWPHGMTNTKPVKRNAVGYLMKYVSKGCDSSFDFPKGARICGSAGLDEPAAHEFHWWRLPRYVRQRIVIGERARRAPGGGWLLPSGEIVESDWGVHMICKVGLKRITVLREGATRKTAIRCGEYALPPLPSWRLEVIRLNQLITDKWVRARAELEASLASPWPWRPRWAAVYGSSCS